MDREAVPRAKHSKDALYELSDDSSDETEVTYINQKGYLLVSDIFFMSEYLNGEELRIELKRIEDFRPPLVYFDLASYQSSLVHVEYGIPPVLDLNSSDFMLASGMIGVKQKMKALSWLSKNIDRLLQKYPRRLPHDPLQKPYSPKL